MPALNECLNADEAMARLAAHAGNLLKLQQIVAATIPSALAKSCRVANYKLGVLVIHADNGAVAAKLRQMAPTLSDELRSRGTEVTEIRFKVQPRESLPPPPPRIPVAIISEEAKRGLTNLSTQLPEGSSLKVALERLVSRAK